MSVRLKAALVLETIACGKRSMNRVQKTSTIAPHVAANARAGCPPASAAAATSATTAPAAQMADAASTPSWLTSVQARKAVTTTAASGAVRAAIARARSSIGPAVLRLRKIAPWARNSVRVATPPSSA